jgi:hypothetical protein
MDFLKKTKTRSAKDLYAADLGDMLNQKARERLRKAGGSQDQFLAMRTAVIQKMWQKLPLEERENYERRAEAQKPSRDETGGGELDSDEYER